MSFIFFFCKNNIVALRIVNCSEKVFHTKQLWTIQTTQCYVYTTLMVGGLNVEIIEVYYLEKLLSSWCISLSLSLLKL